MKNKLTFNELISGDQPVLVDFYAEWCGPCKMMSPILQELREKMGDAVKVIKIDVEKNPRLASSLRIQGVPTLMLFQQKEVLWRQSGVVPANQLEQVVQKHAKKVKV